MTTIASNQNTSESKNSFLNELYSYAEFNRFGIICASIIATGCMGGAAVGMGAISNPIQLTLIVMSTMATLAMVLAVAPMKWIINLSFIAIAIDTVLLLINLLF